MLDAAHEELAGRARHRRNDREVVRFGPAAREKDVARIFARESRDRLARALDPLARRAPLGMNARRIAPRLARGFVHRSERARVRRCGRIPIEVRAQAHLAIVVSTSTARKFATRAPAGTSSGTKSMPPGA